MHANEIEIPQPCHEDWDAMSLLQRGRHCDACRQTVHDLSSMTEREAKKLLSSGEDVCISFHEDDNGSIKFRPAPVVPLTALTRRLPQVAAAGLSLALAACAPHGDAPSLDAMQDAAPSFFEYRSSIIPEAEPCESTPPPVVEVPPQVEDPPPVVEVEKIRKPRMGKPVMHKKGKLKRDPRWGGGL